MSRSSSVQSHLQGERLTLEPTTALPSDLLDLYNERRPAILARLADFAAVPQDAWFYELCYCLLTPQSRAVHADSVVQSLVESRFFETGCDVLHLLSNKEAYIRFHNVKHNRLHAIRQQWSIIENLLMEQIEAESKRTKLVQTVNGLGMKEASHFLRNIGYRGLAIIDRHLITNLVRCGVHTDAPSVASASQYLAVEAAFRLYAAQVRIDLDELDLLFWSAQTGVILK